MRIRHLAIIIILQLTIFSCRNRSTDNEIDTERKETVQISKDSSDRITNDNKKGNIPGLINDSIGNFCDCAIGRFKVKYYTRNDSTCKFVPGPLQKYANPQIMVDSIALPYARKGILIVSDGNKVYQKEITRNDLQKTIKVEDIEYFQIHTITAKQTSENSLLFTISLSMDDTLYVYEFDYEYFNGIFTLKKYRIYDDEGVDEIKI